MKEKNKKKLWKELLYYFSIFLIVFFGFKVLTVLIITPILTQYAAAYDWYIITGSAEYFTKAADFVSQWFLSWLFFLLGVVLFMLMRKKKDE